MTIAICVKCGTKKFGAFSSCSLCGVNPANSKDLAKSIMFSSHYYTFAELDEISAEIALTGKIPVFAEKRQSDLINTIENSPYLDMLLEKPEKPRLVEIRKEVKRQRTNFPRPSRIVCKFIMEAWGRLSGRK